MLPPAPLAVSRRNRILHPSPTALFSSRKISGVYLSKAPHRWGTWPPTREGGQKKEGSHKPRTPESRIAESDFNEQRRTTLKSVNLFSLLFSLAVISGSDSA